MNYPFHSTPDSDCDTVFSRMNGNNYSANFRISQITSTPALIKGLRGIPLSVFERHQNISLLGSGAKPKKHQKKK